MQTFVKLRPAARLSYLGFSHGEGVESTINVRNYALDVKGPAWVNGEPETEIKVNQSFTLRLGLLAPKRYTCMVVVHSQLQCATMGPSIMVLEPGEVVDLNLTFKALKNINLTEMPYSVRLYLID